MKYILICKFLFISSVVFSQNMQYWKNLMDNKDSAEKWVDKVNEFMKPNYVLLGKGCGGLYKEYDINNDNKNELIVSVTDTTNDKDGLLYNKILIFKMKNEKLVLIDSSDNYESDPFGPLFQFSKDTLQIKHNYNHGSYYYTYIFDTKLYKYQLLKAENFEVSWWLSYNVKTQILTIKSIVNDDKNINPVYKKYKVIKRKLPPNMSLNLSDFGKIDDVGNGYKLQLFEW